MPISKKPRSKTGFRTSAKASAPAALPEASKRATQWTFQPSHGAVATTGGTGVNGRSLLANVFNVEPL
jgi:hypothetical protein